MNLQRACKQALDIANHVIKAKKLGLPKDSRDTFALLQQAGLIAPDQQQALQAMVGFRNILVHEYQKLDVGILEGVIRNRMYSLLDFTNSMLELAD